jgi:hypothetical protein
MIKVVHPAYHCLPNGGHGSFFPSASLRLSCDRVFATMAWSGSAGQVERAYSVHTLGRVCDCWFRVSGRLA